MNISMHGAKPIKKFETFFYNSQKLAMVRDLCRRYPGLRLLFKRNTGLQYSNLLTVYAAILRGNLHAGMETTAWTRAVSTASLLPIQSFFDICGYPHTAETLDAGQEFPTQGLGIFVSPAASFANSVIIVDRLHLPRWCNSRVIPSAVTHATACTAGKLWMLKES